MVPLSNMILARSQMSVIHFNNIIYCIGGVTDQGGVTNQCEKYLVEKNRWSMMPSLNISTCCSSVCIFKNKIYKFGGKTAYHTLTNDIEVFDFEK
jgi:N-acetylneuraminic acid mutarotase